MPYTPLVSNLRERTNFKGEWATIFPYISIFPRCSKQFMKFLKKASLLTTSEK